MPFSTHHTKKKKKNIFPNKSPKQEPDYKIPLYEITWYIMEHSGNSRIFKKQFSSYCAVALEADPRKLLRTSMAPLAISVGTMKLLNNSPFPNVCPFSPGVSQEVTAITHGDVREASAVSSIN